MFVGFDTTLILPQRDGQLIQLSIRIVKGLSTFLTRRSTKQIYQHKSLIVSRRSKGNFLVPLIL